MEPEDLLYALPWLIIMLVFWGIYLFKTQKAHSGLSKATKALHDGDDSLAVSLLIQALKNANEKPALERKIIHRLKDLYQHHNLSFDFTSYEALIRQFEALSKKGSNKALRELTEVQGLKEAIVHKLPNL